MRRLPFLLLLAQLLVFTISGPGKAQVPTDDQDILGTIIYLSSGPDQRYVVHESFLRPSG